MPGPRTEPTAGGPLLSERQAGELLGISAITLSQWRRGGTGPPFLKMHGCIRYMRDTVVAWAKAHEVGTEATS
jgi:hypothetical protein